MIAVTIHGSAENIYDDNFDQKTLGKQWYVEMGPLWFWSIPGALDPYATVKIENGQAVLTSSDKILGSMVLAYGPSRLTGPWAVEIEMICPKEKPFRCGFHLRLTGPEGLVALVGIARQSAPEDGLVLLSGETSASLTATSWPISPEIARADRLLLRIESVEKDLSQVRLGARLSAADAWRWSQPRRFGLPPVYIGDIRLANYPAPGAAGKPVSTAFEYFHCEGNDFAPTPPPRHSLDLLQRTAKMNPFDLELRAELAINAMIGVMDPIQGAPLFLSYLGSPIWMGTPVKMFAGEYLDGLTMARIISGSRDGENGEKMMSRLIREIQVQGWKGGHKHILPGILTLHRLVPGNPHPMALVRESLRVTHKMALRGKLTSGEPYLYFPVPDSVSHSGDYSSGNYDGAENGETKEPIDTGTAGFHGTITLPFAQYYEMTKDPEAAEFLDQFICFLLKRAKDFNPDASFTNSSDVVNGQLWSRMMTIEGILIYGLAAGCQDLVDWARRAFDQARRLHGTRFGWMPENLNQNHDLACEADTITAQIEIAFLLARKVDDYYWEEAERIAMNQLLAQQLIRVDFLGGPTAKEAAALISQPVDPKRQRLTLDPAVIPPRFNGYVEYDFEQVPLRLLGGFASMCGPNDWDSFMTLVPNYITQSSHGSGMRALYNTWYHAAWWERGEETGEAGRTLRVNLHWSKSLPGAQVISHLPASTRLEIKLERTARLIVRKPAWAQMEHIRAQTSDGQSIALELKGRWLHLCRQQAGTHIVLSFPDEVVTHRDIIITRTPGVGYYGPLKEEPPGGTKWHEAVFTTQWRGNAVIAIEPRGRHQPSYDGRQGCAPYVPRYTAEEALDPITMTPFERTADMRTERIVQ